MTVTMPEPHFYALPASFQERLRAYSLTIPKRTDQGELVFELGDSRWDEIKEQLAKIVPVLSR